MEQSCSPFEPSFILHYTDISPVTPWTCDPLMCSRLRPQLYPSHFHAHDKYRPFLHTQMPCSGIKFHDRLAILAGNPVFMPLNRTLTDLPIEMDHQSIMKCLSLTWVQIEMACKRRTSGEKQISIGNVSGFPNASLRITAFPMLYPMVWGSCFCTVSISFVVAWINANVDKLFLTSSALLEVKELEE